MAIIRYKNVGIRAMSACVPSQIYSNRDLGYLIPEDAIENTIRNIGIEERRVAPPDVCASDLCLRAAQRLLADNDIAPESIDVLLFMSQTSDYRMPATAPILQHRLGLPKDTAAMDLSLACSGYVFALSTAFAYASQEGVRRVLLLDGDTVSRLVSHYDKVDWPLYGDAGTATLIEKGDYGESTFVLRSDGGGAESVYVPAGGMRQPATVEALEETEREEGNRRSDMQVVMDGMAVFNFAMSVVPKGVKEIVKLTDTTLDDIDWLVFHQANKFMTDFFAKRLKFDMSRVPYCIQKYGNTSSPSVPLTIVSELSDKMRDGDRVVMCGYGAGLSWGTAMVTFRGCQFSPVIDYQP